MFLRLVVLNFIEQLKYFVNYYALNSIYCYINTTIINSKANLITFQLVINSIHNYLNFLYYNLLKSNICKDGQFFILKH